jgi:hypothetical protein
MSKLTDSLRNLPVPVEILEKNKKWEVIIKINFSNKTNRYERVTLAREYDDFNDMCRVAIRNFKAGQDFSGKPFEL